MVLNLKKLFIKMLSDGTNVLRNYFQQAGSGNTAGRPASANNEYHDNKLRFYLATGSMTTGKPPQDAAIVHLPWDNTGYDMQIAIGGINTGGANPMPKAYIRNSNSSGTWSNWIQLQQSLAHTNEFNIGGGAQNGNLWFNYRNADTDAQESTAQNTNYRFGNYKGGVIGTKVIAGAFEGDDVVVSGTSIAPKNGTFTPVTGITTSEVHIKQFGPIVTISLYLTKSDNFAANTQIEAGSISGVTASSTSIRFPVVAGTAAYDAKESGYGVVSGGKLYIRLATARPIVDVCMCYSV